MTEYTQTHCPYCGNELDHKQIEGRERLYCTQCDRVIYQNPDPTASLAVVDGDQVLLVKRRNEPDRGQWGLPAGYIEVDEKPPVAAARELREETGLEADPTDFQILDTIASQHDNGRRIISIGYAVSADVTTGSIRPGKEVSEVAFWDPEELSTTPDEELREHDSERVSKAITVISQDYNI